MSTTDDAAIQTLGKLTLRQAETLICSFKIFVEAAVTKVLADQRQEQVRRKVQVTDEDKVKAAELRAALLMGKIPEGVGLLVDAKTVADLLGISHATLYRLMAMEAIPAPVRLGRAIRWKTRQILKWVDDGCPKVEWRASERRRYRATTTRTQARSQTVSAVPGAVEDIDAGHPGT